MGSLHNLSKLNKQYGLSKVTNEALFIIEAYRTLRDRGPYPADQRGWFSSYSENLELIKASCAKSFAPFPAGCMFHSEHGLMNFEHPTMKMKAMPRIDSEGIMWWG
ncbi:hypothetical protein SESBI_44760 [Sesbania bispinosa]|nr:hypothetical protein SESBI_44760 [Sesbania bispinosa]